MQSRYYTQEDHCESTDSEDYHSQADLPGDKTKSLPVWTDIVHREALRNYDQAYRGTLHFCNESEAQFVDGLLKNGMP